MKKLSDYTGKVLLLMQPGFFKRLYELRCDNEIIATVELKGLFDNRAIFSSTAGSWEIYKPSHWKSTVAVRQAGYEMPFAQFVKDKWKSNGTIELPKGDKIRFIRNLWKGIYELQNSSGIKIASMKRLISFKDKIEISIDYGSESLDRNPWMIIMMWFISLENRRHSAVVS